MMSNQGYCLKTNDIVQYWMGIKTNDIFIVLETVSVFFFFTSYF